MIQVIYMVTQAVVATLNGWSMFSEGLYIPENIAVQRMHEYKSIPYSRLENQLRKQSQQPDILVGWSLGGQLAMRLVAEKIITPKVLILLATPLQFDTNIFTTFSDLYNQSTDKALHRFAWLMAKGDANLSASDIAPLVDYVHPKSWRSWLTMLQEGTLIDTTLSYHHFPSTFIIHGKDDHVVPVAQAQLLHQTLPDSTLLIWNECGHAPHIHAPKRWHNIIKHATSLYAYAEAS